MQTHIFILLFVLSLFSLLIPYSYHLYGKIAAVGSTLTKRRRAKVDHGKGGGETERGGVLTRSVVLLGRLIRLMVRQLLTLPEVAFLW